MKYDLSKKPTRGAQRTLDAFSSSLMILTAEKDFESISVNEICIQSNYPRATFYNYFEDKHDLLNYVWYLLAKKIELDKFQEVDPDDLIITYFDRVYDIFSSEEEFLTMIMRHNGYNSSLVQSFIAYFKKTVHEILYEYIVNNPKSIDDDIPLELLADHFTNTVILLIDWIFLRKRRTTKKEAHNYLKYLMDSFVKL